MTEAINVAVLRSELMKFSKEETKLLGALLELARIASENGRGVAVPSTHQNIEAK
jgi:hypothetical protein